MVIPVEDDYMNVINQIEGQIFTLREGRNLANIAADLW